MSGLRSQREYTITCVSLRSGIASSGTARIDCTPATTATPTSTNTMKRFFAENSMMASITAVPRVRRGRGLRRRRRRCARLAAGGLLRRRGAHAARRGFQLALGINQEHAGRHHALARGQPACNRDAVAEAFPNDDGPRLEISAAEIDEHRL